MLRGGAFAAGSMVHDPFGSFAGSSSGHPQAKLVKYLPMGGDGKMNHFASCISCLVFILTGKNKKRRC